MKIKSFSSRFFGVLTIIALLVFLVGPGFAQATALSLTSASDTMTNETMGATSYSDHTFAFTGGAGHTYTNGDTITIASPTVGNFTSSGTWAASDFVLTMAGTTPTDVAVGASTPTCTAAVGAYTVLYTNSTTPSFLITLCSAFGTSSATPAVTFKIKGASGTGRLANSTTAVSSATWTINESANSDSTTVADVVIANDAVAVTAAVAPTMTFSVGTGYTSGTVNNGVALGTLAPTKFSDGSTVNSIWLGLATNSSSGASVSVVSSNNGALVSVSKPADTIPYSGGSFASPTLNTTYGDCVNGTPTASTGTLSKSSPFNGTCGHTSASVAGQLTNAAQTIISSTGLLAGGQAEVVVGATSYSATPPHSDYADTQTFIATGTF